MARGNLESQQCRAERTIGIVPDPPGIQWGEQGPEGKGLSQGHSRWLQSLLTLRLLVCPSHGPVSLDACDLSRLLCHSPTRHCCV